MSTAEKTKKASSVMPFVIEANTPRNQDLMIQNLERLRLRGAVHATVEVFDKLYADEDDDRETPTRPTGAKIIEGVPELPGMQLYVNPTELRWEMKDPICKDERLLEKIANAMSEFRGSTIVGQKLRGMKPKSGTIGRDEMKTLCAELLCFIDADEAKVIKGMAPSKEDIDELPGRYLLNWSGLDDWKQPRYADEYDEWIRRSHNMSGE